MPNQGDRNPNGSNSWWDGTRYAKVGDYDQKQAGWWNGSSYVDYNLGSDGTGMPSLQATDNGKQLDSGNPFASATTYDSWAGHTVGNQVKPTSTYGALDPMAGLLASDPGIRNQVGNPTSANVTKAPDPNAIAPASSYGSLSPSQIANGVSPGISSSNGQLTKFGGGTSEGTASGLQDGGAPVGNVPGQTGVTTTGGNAGAPIGAGSGGAAAGAQPLPQVTPSGGNNNAGLAGSTQPGGAATAGGTSSFGNPMPLGGGSGSAATPLPTTPGGTMPGAPTSTNPYGALSSSWQGMANPYTGDYAARTAAAGRGAIQNEYAQAQQNLQADYAARGLTNAGMSGLEAGDLRSLEMGRAHDLGALDAQSYFNTVDKGTAFDSQRAGALDAFGLAKAGGTQGYNAQSFDQYARGALLPGQVTQQNQQIQAFAQEFPSILQKMQGEGAISQYDAQAAQWVAQNQGWMAALSFLGNLAKGAAPAAGALAASALF